MDMGRGEYLDRLGIGCIEMYLEMIIWEGLENIICKDY